MNVCLGTRFLKNGQKLKLMNGAIEHTNFFRILKNWRVLAIGHLMKQLKSQFHCIISLILHGKIIVTVISFKTIICCYLFLLVSVVHNCLLQIAIRKNQKVITFKMSKNFGKRSARMFCIRKVFSQRYTHVDASITVGYWVR